MQTTAILTHTSAPRIPNAHGRIPDAAVRKAITVRISTVAHLNLSQAARTLNARPGVVLNMFAEAIGALPAAEILPALAAMQKRA